MSKHRGFTLIEIIIGIVVIAIVTVVVTAGIGPLFQKTSDPWFQVRASELGQSLMNEVMGHKFDERNNANFRCSSATQECTNPAPPSSFACPAAGNPLPNTDGGETRETFDDVDDFNCVGITTTGISNILGENIDASYYQGFGAEIRVYTAAGNENRLKTIEITIVTPDDQRITFSAARGNW